MKLQLFSDWNRALLPLLSEVGQPAFVPALKQALDQLLGPWQLIVWYYPHAGRPVPLHSLDDSPSLQQDVERYSAGPYLLDPFYLAGRSGQNGCFTISELAPSGFKLGEYYRSYYRFLQCSDEIGFIVKAESGFCNISLGRQQGQKRFSKTELGLLQAAWPLLEQLCRDHLQALDKPSQEGQGLYPQLAHALDQFATSVLTQREAEVVQLLLKGYATQSAADKLGISPQTIKLHRKNSYAKLDVSSQAELFYLFIDSLSCVEQAQGGDTLAIYLAVKR